MTFELVVLSVPLAADAAFLALDVTDRAARPPHARLDPDPRAVTSTDRRGRCYTRAASSGRP